MDAGGSDEIGLGPYTGNYWRLTVGDGRIVAAQRDIAFMTNGFSDQIWEPFAEWVSIEHRDDVLAMCTDERQGMQRVTHDSIRLWEQHTAEYVALVTQNLDAYPLEQSEVAAYVAELDSICSAAQAKLSDEIQAVADPGQGALIEVHERIMRETIPELRAVPVPSAVRWPYEGRAFLLMENFSQYGESIKRVPPHERELETLLLSRIQLTPGLDKCGRW
jgi:hypothetical protein